jgi:hypothetical protein
MVDTVALNDALAGGYLLVDYTLRGWGGTKTDREASDEVIASHGTTKDAGRFLKNLLAGADVELKTVKNRANAIGVYIHSKTLPWSSNTIGARRGTRLLAATESFEFLKGLNVVKGDYDTSVQQLAAVWTQRVGEAIGNLKGLANPNDYPTSADIVGLFGVSIEVKPVPRMSDFSRTNIPPALADALGQRLAGQAQVQMSGALDDLKGQVLKALQRIATQLGKAGAGEKTKLFDSLVTNMQDLVNMIRAMNAGGNAELNAFADKIETQLLAQPVQVYRDFPAKAAEAATAAQAIALDATLASIWSP